MQTSRSSLFKLLQLLTSYFLVFARLMFTLFPRPVGDDHLIAKILPFPSHSDNTIACTKRGIIAYEPTDTSPGTDAPAPQTGLRPTPDLQSRAHVFLSLTLNSDLTPSIVVVSVIGPKATPLVARNSLQRVILKRRIRRCQRPSTPY
jgi:hypothetical protein